jgi:hypothetical protein
MDSGSTCPVSRHSFQLPTAAEAPLDVATSLLHWHIDRVLSSPRWRGPSLVPLVTVRYSAAGPHISPPSLLAGLWLQFAFADHEGKQFTRCPARNCPCVWFEKSTGPGVGKREDAEFCSTRCRHTAYRDRKTQAREMFRDGRTTRAIAKTIGTEESAVRGWVKGLKQPER